MRDMKSWNEVRAALEARRNALNEEIAGYPAPVPGCDAQFNHLLEERARIAKELGRLDGAKGRSSDQTAVLDFVESCPFLTGAGGEKHT